MENFGEELAYWYFRMNGFFLVRNFIHHSIGHDDGADSDLLGLRLKSVGEIMWDPGERCFQELTWDRAQPEFKKFLQEGTKDWKENIAIIVEVKSGIGKASTENAFEKTRLHAALTRLGLHANEANINELAAKKEMKLGDWQILKFLACRKSNEDSMAGNYYTIPFDHMIHFISKRFDDYPKKRSNWNHFPSDLMQYIAFNHIEKQKNEKTPYAVMKPKSTE